MMYLFKYSRIFLIAAVVLVVSAPTSAQVQSPAFRMMLRTLLSHSVPETNVAEAARDSAKILFLDAREWREYEVSHINNAMFAGYDDFEIAFMQDIPLDTRIVVYCSVGYRSEKITEKLQKAGYNKVSNLVGGIFEWVNQGYPVFDDKGKTQNIHAFDKTWGVWLKKGKKVYK